MDTIQTIEERFGQQLSIQVQRFPPDMDTLQLLYATPHLWPFYLYPMENMFAFPLGQADSPAAAVRVYRGKWIVPCVFCSSAQHASKDDQWFFCADCTNSSAGNVSIPAVMPDNWEDIEAALLIRPFINTRNWAPGETVEDLLTENEMNGV